MIVCLQDRLIQKVGKEGLPKWLKRKDGVLFRAVADSFDLGDPWHTPQCGTNGSYGGAPFEGQMCCVDKAATLGCAENAILY
eukprot:COSAG06_NODE_9099_length_1986_cov_3.188489_2_plen_82_part_00